MAKVVRRAAKKAIINAKDKHGLLGLLIFDEKLVYEQFRKLVEAKSSASLSLLKWARHEDNIALQDVFSKVFEVNCIWGTAMKQFTNKYFEYRTAFKDVLHEERDVDDLRKKEMAYTAKLNKLQKQLHQTKRKSVDLTKSKPLQDEMTEILTKAEETRAELEVKITKHEIYKAMKLRDALHAVSNSIQTLAEQTLSVSGTYRKLASLIPDTPTQLSEEKAYPEIGQTRQIVSELSRELNIDPEVADIGKTTTQTYLYAVSRVSMPESREISVTPPKSPDPHDASPIRRSPPPVPRRQGRRKISDESLANQHFARPFSLDDLRPPPSCPPPPVPTSPGPLSPDQLSPDRLSRLSPSIRQRNIAGLLLADQKFGRPFSLNDLSVPEHRVITRDREGSSKSLRPRLNSVDNTKEKTPDKGGQGWYARSPPIDESESDDSDGYTEPLEPAPRVQARPPRSPRPPIKKQRAFRKTSEGLLTDRARNVNDNARRHASTGDAENDGYYAQRSTSTDACAPDVGGQNAYASLHRSDPDISASDAEYLELLANPDISTSAEYLELLNR